MPIAFNCPYCGEAYRLKDDLAGKKATCKRVSCRKVFTVPSASQSKAVPAGVSGTQIPIDTEALALSALADEPAQTAAQSNIHMVCKVCDHAWDVELDKQGKNVICPECNTINKVPIPKDVKKQDWRVANQGIPEGAKQNIPKLDGLIEKTVVSVEAMEKAGALPQIEYEPLTLKQKALRYGVVLFVLLLISGGGFYWYSNQTAVKNAKMLNAAIAEVIGEDGTKLAEYQAVVRIANGEYKTRSATSETTLQTGMQELQLARGKIDGLDKDKQPYDQGMLMIELARVFMHLGGEKAEVDANTKRSWLEIQKEVRQSLSKAKALDSDYRLFMIPLLAPSWIQAGKGDQFADIVRDCSPPDEAVDLMSLVGLEMLRFKKKDEAIQVLMLATGKDGPFTTALRSALDQKAETGTEIIPPPAKAPSPVRDDSRLAYAISDVLTGKASEAKALLVQSGPAEGRLRAAILAAEFAESADTGAIADIAAKAYSELKGKIGSPWLAFPLIVQLQRAGKEDQAIQVAKGIGDESAAAWAKCLIIRQKIALDPNVKLDESLADDIAKPDAPNIAASFARYWIARQNAKLSGSAAVAKKANDWPKVTARAFGLLGAVLGAQDKTIK